MIGGARDPISGEPVLLAPGRAERPHDTGHAATRAPRPCPFCDGAEQDTPLEVYAERPGRRAANTPGWTVRVVPNKFPAIAAEAGAHEVIVPTPRHVVGLGELTPQEIARALRVWAARLEVIGGDERGLWPFCFVNQGAAAGASLQHSHAQVIGLPFAPPRMRAREAAFSGGADPIAADLERAGRRLIARQGGLAAWCPEVPPFTGTVRLAPEERRARLGDEADFEAPAHLLHAVVVAIAEQFDDPALNVLVHQTGPDGPDEYHWHIDLVPRLGTLAGLELGTGVVAVAQSPEAVAERLRGEVG